VAERRKELLVNEKESNRQRRFLLWSGLGAVAIVAAGGGAWILSLPPAPTLTAAPPIAKQEADAALTALKPPKRQRPLIAIIGINDATEVTDYLMPYGILRRSDVADVVALATKRGPLKLYPALKVEPQATVAEFEARHPEGADYVIVPAMSRDDDPVVLEWLRSQAAKGAMIIGVCAGAKVVGEAGLLDGKRATTLVLPQGAARQAPRDPLCREPSAAGRPERGDDDGDHRDHADGAHLDRGHCRPRQGRGGQPGYRLDPLGRASRQRCVPVHAPVCVDSDSQYGRVLEPRATRHRADARC
jgi:putative intracellular protease/amidase